MDGLMMTGGMATMILSAALVICAAIWLAAWHIGKRLDGVEIRLNRCIDGLDGRACGLGGRIDRLEKSFDNLAAELRELKENLGLPGASTAAQLCLPEKEGRKNAKNI